MGDKPEPEGFAEERAQRHVDDQRMVVRRLKAEGRDSRPAERLLQTFREILQALRRVV